LIAYKIPGQSIEKEHKLNFPSITTSIVINIRPDTFVQHLETTVTLCTPSAYALIMSIELVQTITQVFGNAPHLFLSILSRYRMSGPAGERPSYSMVESPFLETNVDGEPYPEPPAAPP
jgi:hypothetical protein